MARPIGFSFGPRYVHEAAQSSAPSARETIAFAEKLIVFWLAREGTYSAHAKDSKGEYRRISPSDLKRLANLVFGELEKGLINVRHLLDNCAGDRETLENCLHWAHVHVDIATSLFPSLVCTVPLSAWRKLIERELDLLAKATQDLTKAERHADDPGAVGGFLTPARKHIESAMAVHTRLTEEIRSGAE